MIEILKAEKKTYEEIENKFIENGFTKEDFEKAKEIEKDKTILCLCAPVAKHFSVKPHELLVKAFLYSLGKHLDFD